MTPTEEQIEALAVALHRVVEERRYIDLDATDLAFGGKEPFVDIAAAILAALDGWMLVRTGTEGQRREALDLVERQHVEIARLRKAMNEAANMIHMADWDQPTMHEAIVRTEAILRAVLEAET